MTGVATFAQTEIKPATATTSPARERMTPELQTKKITENLGLNADQQAKVKALYTEQETTRAELKKQRKEIAKDENARAEMLAKVKAEREAFNLKMKEILTPEQFTKWEASKKRTASQDDVKAHPELKDNTAQGVKKDNKTLTPAN